jgi:hypothetical protein
MNGMIMDIKKTISTDNPVTSQDRLIYIAKSFAKNSTGFSIIKSTTFGIIFVYIIVIIIPAILIGVSSLGIVFLILHVLLIIAFYHMFIDVLLYNSIYSSIKYSEKILNHDGKYSINTIMNFENSLNDFRSRLKKNLKRNNSPLSTHDYMCEDTFQNMDVFFDVVLQKISNDRIDKSGKTRTDVSDAYIKQFKDSEILGLNKYDWDVRIIDFNAIFIFLVAFNELFINRPKPVSTKIISIRYFFENWNEILNLSLKEMYKKSEERINKFYSKKHERNEERLKSLTKISENLVASLITVLLSIVAGIILYYFTLNK